jgi:hypothetical protein
MITPGMTTRRMPASLFGGPKDDCLASFRPPVCPPSSCVLAKRAAHLDTAAWCFSAALVVGAVEAAYMGFRGLSRWACGRRRSRSAGGGL